MRISDVFTNGYLIQDREIDNLCSAWNEIVHRLQYLKKMNSVRDAARNQKFVEFFQESKQAKKHQPKESIQMKYKDGFIVAKAVLCHNPT